MTGRRPLLLLGAGGHGSDVLSVVEALADADGGWDVVGLADDATVPPERFEGRATLLGPIDDALAPGVWWVASIGYPEVRRAVADRAEARSPGLAATLVHPDVTPCVRVEVGPGSVVFAGAHLSPLVTIGRHALVAHRVVVGHDCHIADHASLFPGAVIGGECTIGEGATIGAGAVVNQGITIGAGAIVGSGAAVVRDVDPGATVVGVPAKPVQH